jgi:hypothetical protein
MGGVLAGLLPFQKYLSTQSSAGLLCSHNLCPTFCLTCQNNLETLKLPFKVADIMQIYINLLIGHSPR